MVVQITCSWLSSIRPTQLHRKGLMSGLSENLGMIFSQNRLLAPWTPNCLASSFSKFTFHPWTIEFQFLLWRIFVMQSMQVSMELDCSIIAFPSEHMQLIDWSPSFFFNFFPFLFWSFVFCLFSSLCFVLFSQEFTFLTIKQNKFSVVGFWGLAIAKKGCGDSHCWYVMGT